MKTVSLGKYRRLQRCSSATGALLILSVDHRDNLRRLLQPDQPEAVSDADLTSFKYDVVTALGNQGSAVLLDPQYGAGQLIAQSALPKGSGLIVALEATGYTGKLEDRSSRMLSGWSAVKASQIGADAARLLVYYHPEADSAPSIESLVDSVAQECQLLDLPLFLAALTYSVDSVVPLSPHQRRESILATARILTSIPGVDFLMTEFPAEYCADPDREDWEAACSALSHASRTPWILLSAAVDFPGYLRMTEIACRQGASGTAAGRAAWQEAAKLLPEKRRMYLEKNCRSRLSQLAATCDNAAIPWTEFFKPPEVSSNWYETYGRMNNHG